MLQLKCTGLILTPVNALECAEGSIDVQVQIEFDNTYADYTKVLHIGYYDEQGAERGAKASLENDVFKIPGPVFAQSGIIFLSVHFSKTGESSEPETKPVYYQVQKTAGGVGSLPASYIWEPIVKGFVNDYLKSNEVKFGTDTTLTQSGKAADAKVVGDKFRQLWEDIANLPSGGSGTVVSSIEPMEDDMPKVFLNGDEYDNMNSSKNEVNMELDYSSKTDDYHSYIKIKWQGNSSLGKPKHNFTIKMYSDETRETKLKKRFKDWKIESHKYVLKANFIDHSHARNLMGAKLWSDSVRSRNDYENLPNELKTSPNNGAVDGFPIKLYVNGVYQGIYTWNIGKDDWMWNMDEDNPNHVLLCAETNTDGVYKETPCNFRKLWSGTDGTDWSVEVGTNSTSVKNSVNALITCVKDTDDNTFKSTIGNYLDVQSAIDYYIHQYVICGLDGLGKNMLLGTYDLVRWMLGAYDMDSTFGLWWDGSKFVSATYKCPNEYQEQFNLLFERIVNLFGGKVKTEYFKKRKTVYTYANMFSKFERFMDLIGKSLYEEDVEIYPSIPLPTENNIKQIRNFIVERLSYCDEQFANMSDEGNDEPTEPTLTSISATYSGGDVTVGTELTDLASNLVVNANYDDGTSKTVTGYELSGSIVEGSNTITVTYSGMTTTFSVVGYVEDNDEDDELPPNGRYVKSLISDGASWITTDFIPNNTSVFTLEIYNDEWQDYENFFGTVGYGYRMQFAGYHDTSNVIQLTAGGMDIYKNFTPPVQFNIIIDAPKGIITLNGEETAMKSSVNETTPLRLFTFMRNETTPDHAGTFKLLKATVKQNGVLTHKYRPALDGNGTPCVYDVVQGEYLYNSGTGAFTYEE